MKDDKFFWKYKYEPGKNIENRTETTEKINPLVSIITSYYNANDDMDQTINCVLNQTFESWEWIIVDDGSTKKDAIEYLEKVKKIDNRIKIYHKHKRNKRYNLYKLYRLLLMRKLYNLFYPVKRGRF